MPTLTHPDGRSKIVHASATRRIASLEAAGFVLEDAPKRKATKSAATTPASKTSSPEATPDPESLED